MAVGLHPVGASEVGGRLAAGADAFEEVGGVAAQLVVLVPGRVPDGLGPDFAQLALVRYPHEPLNERVWELRRNLTAYDATFVALAEILDVPLVTCDAKLASAPGHTASMKLFGS